MTCLLASDSLKSDVGCQTSFSSIQADVLYITEMTALMLKPSAETCKNTGPKEKITS